MSWFGGFGDFLSVAAPAVGFMGLEGVDAITDPASASFDVGSSFSALSQLGDVLSQGRDVAGAIVGFPGVKELGIPLALRALTQALSPTASAPSFGGGVPGPLQQLPPETPAQRLLAGRRSPPSPEGLAAFEDWYNRIGRGYGLGVG